MLTITDWFNLSVPDHILMQCKGKSSEGERGFNDADIDRV